MDPKDAEHLECAKRRSEELSEHNKRMDALVSRILELCEKEGITMFQMRMLASRLGRAVSYELSNQENAIAFRWIPREDT